jgi:hypothetical protein
MPLLAQDSNIEPVDYYATYRKGLINRHIARNGCFLQQVWLVGSTPRSDADSSWQTIARSGTERFVPSDGAPCTESFTASPLLLEVDRPEHQGPDPDKVVVGGGDNPFLEGGLALMCFSIEIIKRDPPLESSKTAARRLFDFMLASEIREPGTNRRIGYLLRRRNWWSAPAPASLDEYCGVFLGAWFYVRAMEKIGDTAERDRVKAYLDRLGRSLKSHDYLIPQMGFQDLGGRAWHPQTGRDVWAFQFPLTRILKSTLDVSHLADTTIPDERGGKFESLVGLSPRGLFERILDRFHRVNVFEPTFYNQNMLVHGLLMLLVSNPNELVRREIWEQASGFFRGSLASGGLRNPYFGLVWEAWARERGDDSAGTVPHQMYAPIRHPENQLFANLPMREAQGGDPNPPPPSCIINVMSDDGMRHLWGRTYLSNAPWDVTVAELMEAGVFPLGSPEDIGRRIIPRWDTLARKDKDYYTLRVGIDVVGEIGPGRVDHERDERKSASNAYYTPKVDQGFYIEGSGLRYMVCRMLAVYFGKMDIPEIDDSGIAVLQADGPSADRYTQGISFWPRDIRRTISVARRDYGARRGDFHVVYASEDGGLREYRQDNRRVGHPITLAHNFGGNQEYDEVACIQSDYGNPEVIARSGDNLRHFFRSGNSWSGGYRITSAASGAPGFIQSSFGSRGNFEVVVPREGGGFLHIWRDNDLSEEPWYTNRFGGNMRAEAVALIQSNYGNLEIVVRDDDRLLHMWRAGTSNDWSSPTLIAADVRGVPAFLQSSGGTRGNFEVVVPARGSGIRHFFRDNDDPTLPWIENTISDPYSLRSAGGQSRGDFDGVSIVERSDRLELDVYAVSDGGRFFYTVLPVSQQAPRIGGLSLSIEPPLLASGMRPQVKVTGRNTGTATAHDVRVTIDYPGGQTRSTIGTIAAGSPFEHMVQLPEVRCRSERPRFTGRVSGSNLSAVQKSIAPFCEGESSGGGQIPKPDVPQPHPK